MSDDRSRRALEIVAEALELEGGARSARIEETCGEDDALRDEVESLLGAREGMGDFLESSAAALVGSESAATATLEPGDDFGPYRIVRVLGAGGTGTVYEAMQASPHRRVALKVMRAGLDSEAALRRFRDEAEILGRLHHPGVAHVYEAGVREVSGTALPFFALEYVEGARTCMEFAESEGLDPRARLALAAAICDAVQHGHEKGVVHRDLKPGNVLVDETGRPKVIDFGIARSLEGDDAGARRDLVGTLPYMAPERFETIGSGTADVRSDVYALGVLIYELLSGRLPLDIEGAGITDAARIVREDSPTPISTHDRRFRGDVEAIVHRALAKDREDRYPSAAALADDLRRHLSHVPVEAMPPSLRYQLGKFARRQRLAFVALIAVVLALVGGALVSGWFAVESSRRRREAEDLSLENVKKTRDAEFQAYVANLAAAGAALRVNDVGEARLRLDLAPAAHRNWEWHHLRGRLDMSVDRMAWPGAKLAALALSRDGSLLAVASWGLRYWVAVVDARTKRELWRSALRAEALAFSPDGSHVLVGHIGGSLEIRSAADGAIVTVLVEVPGKVADNNLTMAVFSPDGGQVAASSYDGTVRVWETATGRLRRTLTGHEGKVFCVRFDTAGERLYSGGEDATVRIWDVTTGRPLDILEGHASNVEDVAIDEEGRRLVSGSMDGTVRLWDLATQKTIAIGRRHTKGVKGVAFSRDGRTIASASIDRTVRIWSAEDGRELAGLRGHTDRVYDVIAHPDGESLLSCSHDGTVRSWRLDRIEDVPVLRGHGRSVLSLSFDRGGKRILSTSLDGTARVWNRETRRELGAVPVRPVYGRLVALGPAGAKLYCLTPGPDTDIEVRSIPEMRVLARLDASLPWAGRLWHRGGRLVTGLPFARIVEIDPDTGRTIRDSGPKSEDVHGYFAECGPPLAVSLEPRGSIRVWSPESLEPLGTVTVARAPGQPAIAPDPAGRILAAADGTDINLIDWRADRLLATLRGHAGRVNTLAFSPDGTRLASGSSDGTVRLWDTATGEQVLVLHGHTLATHSLAWSPDGLVLASGGGDWFPDACVVRLWESGPR